MKPNVTRLFKVVALAGVFLLPSIALASMDTPVRNQIGRTKVAMIDVKDTSGVWQRTGIANSYAAKKKMKKGPAKWFKKGKKFYAKTCGLIGCHADQSPVQYTGLSKDELAAAIASVPQMQFVKVPKKKSKFILKYLKDPSRW